jgi:hypothetical protein
VLTLPERAVSASPSFAISSQRSIKVPPEPGSESFHRPKRLRVGELIELSREGVCLRRGGNLLSEGATKECRCESRNVLR